MRSHDVRRAIDFIHREGRVLERRIADTVFDGGPPEAVANALLGHRNPDGGFGYGLEPDKRAPSSQPLDVEVAWESLDWAGVGAHDLVLPACDFLASIGPGVSCITADATDHPCAGHWVHATSDPDVNPTAGLAGHLWTWDIDHPWRAAATEFCWAQLEAGSIGDAHSAARAMRFLAVVPDRARASAAIESIQAALPSMAFLQADPDDDAYGVTPLQMQQSPMADGLFDDAVLEAHLDALERSQAPDGGWELSWPTIGPGAVAEWRGRRTLEHLMLLRAYGRVG